MLRGCTARMFFAMALVAISGFTNRAMASLTIVSQNIKVDRADQQVDFNLVFNHSPDWVTTDSFKRHADSFQFEIVPNTRSGIDTFGLNAVRAVVRGDEIAGGTSIPIRGGFQQGSDPGPTSGGWGAVLGTVPFTVQGSHMSFSAPFATLGTTNGSFAYRVFTTNFGTTVSQAQGVSVPLPAAFWTGLILLSTLGLVRGMSRRAQA